MIPALIDASLVRRLLAAQFPHWAHRPVTPVPRSGLDNATFRLADDLSVRLPRYAYRAGPRPSGSTAGCRASPRTSRCQGSLPNGR